MYLSPVDFCLVRFILILRERTVKNVEINLEIRKAVMFPSHSRKLIVNNIILFSDNVQLPHGP